MPDTLLDRAQQVRELVLLAEWGGWLHDLGKLSQRFVESKSDPAYVTATGSASPPPGDEKWRHGEVLRYDQAQLSPPLADFLSGARTMTSDKESWPFTLSGLVSDHHGPKGGHVLELLKRADRNDSGEDEYNAAGLPQSPPTQAATVFGRETPLCAGTLAQLDVARLAFYRSPLLPPPGLLAACRPELWSTFQQLLTQGLGKTQRAANDIRLDQHVWGVASRFKAFVLRDLLDPPAAGEIRNTFRLLTVQWDAWETLTPFARLSDVAGRAALLTQVRDKLRHAIETEYALGNRIYEDDDGIHFLVADLPWGAELETRVRTLVNAESHGEILPVFAVSEATERVTLLAQQRAAARKELPVVGASEWVQSWQAAAGSELCPVCHRRPLLKDAALCDRCAQLRRAGAAQRREQSGTLQTGEIADARGQTALIVARFDLDRWLTGDLLHTLFITSPQDMADVPADPAEARKVMPVPVKDWRELSQAVAGLPETYLHPAPDADQIKAQEDALRNWGKQRRDTPEGQLARWLTAQFGRLQATAEATQFIRCESGISLPNAFLLALARKNPSAARLLRVWQTTEGFLQTQAEALPAAVGAARQRAVLTLRGTPPAEGYYTADLPGLGTAEVLARADGKLQTTTCVTAEQIARLREAARTGALLRLQARENDAAPFDSVHGKPAGDYALKQVDTEAYTPYQVITVSPNLLLAMVPADTAMAIAQQMQAAYAAEFSKVQGRLPFHMGLVFMDAHYPMFAALDTARRFAETFDELGNRWAEATVTAIAADPSPGGDGKDYTLHLHSERFGNWHWRASARLGNDAMDYYHPYMLVQSGAALEQRGMSLLGPHGRWVHISQVQAGDVLGFLPNLFDFIALDAVSRRLEAHLDPEIRDRRPHPLLGTAHSPRPYLLERVGDFPAVWAAICGTPGMSESRLQAATTLLARKWAAWELAQQPAGAQAEPYRWLVEQTAARDFGKNPALQSAIAEGLYFDVIELYRHILKHPVETLKTHTKKEEVA